MDDSQKQVVLTEFLSATGADSITAETLLQVADWDIEQAVSLFYAQYDMSQQPPANGSGGNDAPGIQARSSGEIRAPDAQRVDRLYEHEPLIRPTRPSAHRQHNEEGAFRDFSTEYRRPPTSQPTGGSSSGTAVDPLLEGGVVGEGSTSLAQMYQAPNKITWKGSFEEAFEAAQGKNRWLIVNIQSNQQFASHQLNSDTWSEEVLQEIIKNNFIFWQAYSSHQSTQQIMANYNISEQQLPVIIIIDPLTRQKMKDWSGFVQVDKLMEGLIPYMDHNPQDPEAHKLAQSAAQRTLQEDVRQNRVTSTPMDEDESLQAAIEASLFGHTTDMLGNNQGFEDMADDSVEIIEKSPDEIQQEAKEALPPEPSQHDQERCRVGFMWPNGQRGQRRFRKTDKVRDIRNYCISQVLDAACGTKFQLLPNFPGAEPFREEEQTLQEAGIVNSMVVMKLLD